MTKTKNKIAWITGGGTGIGKELAQILSDNNSKNNLFFALKYDSNVLW